MVVLAGDLNIRARCVDTAPSMRILNLDLIRLSSSEELRHVREIVRDVWPKVHVVYRHSRLSIAHSVP